MKFRLCIDYGDIARLVEDYHRKELKQLCEV